MPPKSPFSVEFACVFPMLAYGFLWVFWYPPQSKILHHRWIGQNNFACKCESEYEPCDALPIHLGCPTPVAWDSGRASASLWSYKVYAVWRLYGWILNSTICCDNKINIVQVLLRTSVVGYNIFNSLCIFFQLISDCHTGAVVWHGVTTLGTGDQPPPDRVKTHSKSSVQMHEKCQCDGCKGERGV